MTKFKKIMAVMLSVVMIVCMFSVPTSAASVFDGAKTLKALETVSGKYIPNEYKDFYYKISLPDSGTISFKCEDFTGGGWVKMWLLNSEGNEVMKESILNSSCYVKKKGTYYIRVRIHGYGESKRDDPNHFKNLYYSFAPDETPAISLGLNVKVGDELDFSALATNYTGSARWGTTKKAVATVDKGKVKVVGVGKAKIRAYMDNDEYAEITLIATKKK